MLTLVCVEEMANLRQAEEERRLAQLVLLAEARRPSRPTAVGAVRFQSAVGEVPQGAGASPSKAPIVLADWRRGLGRKLIATGERLAGVQTDHDPVPAA